MASRLFVLSLSICLSLSGAERSLKQIRELRWEVNQHVYTIYAVTDDGELSSLEHDTTSCAWYLELLTWGSCSVESEVSSDSLTEHLATIESLQELEFLTKQLVAPAAENYGQPIVLVDGRCEDQTCKYESGTSQQAGLLFPKKLLEAVKNRNGKCLVISNDSDHPLSRSDCKVSFLIKEQSPKCDIEDKERFSPALGCLPEDHCTSCAPDANCTPAFDIDMTTLDRCMCKNKNGNPYKQCTLGATCNATTRVCVCNDNFVGDPHVGGCVALDAHPCTTEQPCDVSSAICVPQSTTEYVCTCREGYQTSNDSTVCSDTNECAPTEDKSQSCSGQHETCVNTQGSFRCDCAPGYERNSTNTCVCRDAACQPDLSASTEDSNSVMSSSYFAITIGGAALVLLVLIAVLTWRRRKHNAVDAQKDANLYLNPAFDALHRTIFADVNQGYDIPSSNYEQTTFPQPTDSEPGTSAHLDQAVSSEQNTYAHLVPDSSRSSSVPAEGQAEYSTFDRSHVPSTYATLGYREGTSSSDDPDPPTAFAVYNTFDRGEITPVQPEYTPMNGQTAVYETVLS